MAKARIFHSRFLYSTRSLPTLSYGDFVFRKTRPNLFAPRPPCTYRSRNLTPDAFADATEDDEESQMQGTSWLDSRVSASVFVRLIFYSFIAVVWISVLRFGDGKTEPESMSAKFKNLLVYSSERTGVVRERRWEQRWAEDVVTEI